MASHHVSGSGEEAQQSGTALRGRGPVQRGGLLGHRGVAAKWQTRCKKCSTLIVRGNTIVFDKRLRAFVHASCAVIQNKVITAARECEARGDPNARLPDGIKSGTLRTYSSEWNRYVEFAERVTVAVPGRDRDWDAALLWAYMSFRAQSCRPSTIVSNLSALAHFGVTYGFLSPNSKYDGKRLLHYRLSRMKRQIAINKASTAQTRIRRRGVRRWGPRRFLYCYRHFKSSTSILFGGCQGRIGII